MTISSALTGPPSLRAPSRLCTLTLSFAMLGVLSGCSPVQDTPIQTPVVATPETFVPLRIDLPVLKLTTANGAAITSEDDYIGGHLTLTPFSDPAVPVADMDMQIKGHGSSSWVWAKKPYKIKLSSKASLLGMPSQKNWILLANFDDKSLMRNDVAFELSRRVGMAYTPRSQFIEVFLNGQYEGSYQLTESIEIDKNRVNIDSLATTDVGPPAVTGGYLMEVDYHGGTDTNFFIGGIIPLTVHDPDPMVPEQQNYLSDYVNRVQNTLYGADFADPSLGYAQYLDVDSFVNWYLVNEIFKNNDAVWWSSVYLYKAREGALALGPVWDFDLGAGNSNLNNTSDPSGWWVRNPWVPDGQWMARLFEDPAFRAKVKARWNALKVAQFDTLPTYVATRAASLELTQQNNFTRWPVLSTLIYTEAELAGTYAGEVAYLTDWLTRRIAWMDAQINDPSY